MEQKEKTGFIYVLTNESFHKANWIKIGYAEDVDKRVKDLSGNLFLFLIRCIAPTRFQE
ncbi:GIY-YIG nuclease family protein [Hallerella porci]|uniref:T5orf172 domain-containing protein n=1 Tax=Hallerella porci TaxID=1945871 RepID=A0ABX5LMG8_9BACT|nr:GIY-YIG nuclease family protein [Hallerella porci]PWK93487.1 T5orf172 domain-containing protein [Hallerella porci]